VNQVQQFVLNNDGVGDGGDVDVHIFPDSHWRPEVEVFEIKNGKVTISGGDGAVENHLGSGHFGSGRACFARIVDQVPTHSEAHTFDLSVVRAIGCYKTCVGGPMPGGSWS
jgi:hypothetical protein